MGSSITNCVSILNQIITSPAGTYPITKDHEEIRRHLHRGKTPEWLEQWHATNMAWVQTESRSLELDQLCGLVGAALMSATKKTSVLRGWADGELDLPQELPARELLFRALCDVRVAFESFEIVARQSQKMSARHIMGMVRVYLRQVFDLAVILGSIAGPDGWFQQCAQILRDSDMEGFVFDTADFYENSLLQDRTLKGVLAQLDQVPSNSLPARPDPPVLGRVVGRHETLVQRNLYWVERSGQF